MRFEAHRRVGKAKRAHAVRHRVSAWARAVPAPFAHPTVSAVPFAPTAVRRVKRTRQQIGLGQREREDNVRAAFAVPPEAEIDIRGKRVLVVDDVYTTGATVAAVTRALKKGGASAVDVLTFARVLPGDFRPDEADTI